LQIDNHLNCANHIDKLIGKISGACYADRWMSHITNTGILISIYLACFHSIMKNGTIFWGKSSQSKIDIHFTKGNS
jgi:hypothetical protein